MQKIVKQKIIRYQISFISFNNKKLKHFCNMIAYILKTESNFLIGNSINLPQKIYKICVLKSPFIYKKKQELFELRTYKYLFNLNFLPKQKKLLDLFFLKLIKKMPPGIDLKIKTIS